MADETLEATWWLFDTEEGMDDIMTQAGDSLKESLFDKFNIKPFQDTQEKDKMFVARFEVPLGGQDFQFPEAIIANQEQKPVAWMDFLGGFPLDCCEMMVIIGERSSKKLTTPVQDGSDLVVPPIPAQFFSGYPDDKILMNYLALASTNVEWIAANLGGCPAPTNLHWWLRMNLQDNSEANQFPVPGEFMALGARMMPDMYWAVQKTSPFLYSGQWFDTVYYTGAKIKEVLDGVPSTYTVTWRGQEIQNVHATDHAEYKVGDRVTILKDITTEKKSQLWKDDDMKTWGTDKWMIAPITFYGLDYQQEG